MAYENQEFIVYSESKEAFAQLASSGGISTSQIGIIAETSEFWANGEYYPLVKLEDYMKRGDAIDTAIDLAGVMEPTQETFVFRSSAGGKSIRDKSALISSIKGNTIVWNQMIENGDFSNGTTNFSGVNTTLSIAPGGGMIVANNTGNSQGVLCNLSIPANHKVLISIDYKRHSTNSSNCVVYLRRKNIGMYDMWRSSAIYSDLRRVDKTIISTTDEIDSLYVYPYISGPIGSSATIYSIMLFDLTKMFGVGNEPESAEDFSAVFNETYYPYCEPSLRGVSTLEIKTTGFNQFDAATSESGYINDENGGVLSSSSYRTSGFIRVLPNTNYYLKDVCNGIYHPSYALYDSQYKCVGINRIEVNASNPPANASSNISIPAYVAYMRVTTHNDFVNTCNVNISHSQVLNGETRIYEEHTRTLPEIGEYFTDGMHNVNGIFDEINDQYAIKRTYVRPYIDVDSSDDTVMTDGISTVCVLDKPIITPLRNPIQLDYWVEDWGTEEAISIVPSAPFSADIVYAFNAEGRIRDNARNIEKIEAKMKESVPPYIIKSFTASFLAGYDGDFIYTDDGISHDDLFGGLISEAIKSGAQVYIKAGDESDSIFGVTPVVSCYLEDLIYLTFINKFDSLIYNLEMGSDGFSITRSPLYQEQSDWENDDDSSPSYIRNKPIMPTEVATATQRMRVTSETTMMSMQPNVIYDWTGRTMTNLSMPSLRDGDNLYDNKWMARFVLSSSTNLSISFNVLWKDGIPPTWNEWCICEMTFSKDLAGNVCGEWKIYK